MNQQMIITAVTSIIGTVSVLFATKWVDAYFKVYPPDIKKHISLMKKFVFITVSYILPIISIICLMVYYKTIDKFFVFAMAINFSGMVLCTSLFLSVLTLKRENEMLDIHTRHIDMSDRSANIMKDMVTQDVQIVDLLKSHSKAIELLVDAVKKLETNQNTTQS